MLFTKFREMILSINDLEIIKDVSALINKNC